MLTVLLATRDRAWPLGEVLETFCRLQPPSSGWKLVVVDNGSTDGTPQVLQSFADLLPLHVIAEPKPGKNHALNAGLDLVEGDLAVFTDDDVFPRPDWLVRLRRAADAHPECSILGGAIVPRWGAPPPEWLDWIDLGPIFTITPPWMKEGELSPDDVSVVQGPNMAIRATVFQAGIRFDPSIGPRGSSYPMGSETEILRRLSLGGHRAWHVMDAVVEHFVRADQMDKGWILRRAIRFGRGLHRMSPNVNSWIGIPRHLFRDIPKEGMFIIAAWALFRPAALFRARWRFNCLRGKAIEAIILGRERRTQNEVAQSLSPPCGDAGEPTPR